MITCSKCKQQFPLNWRMISKDSTVHCTHCNEECLVTLFDLKNSDHSEENEGFGSVTHTYSEIRAEDEKEEKSLNNHLLATMVILNLIAGAFILGMYNISFLEENLPQIARLYNAIKIIAKKTIVVESFKVEKVNNIMTVNLNLENSSDKIQILSDIQILVRDSFNNIISATRVEPGKVIEGKSKLNIKINLTGVNDNGKKISIFINGSVAMESKITL